MATACVARSPPLGMAGGCGEPLLFLGTMVAGEAFGHTIDASHLTIFVLSQMASAARVTEEKNRALAAEEINRCQATALHARIERERAEKEADSMLNHNLKNIMADGIASVELYELTANDKHLANAKLSMKRGMTWTRRRQSLIMLCDGTYQVQNERMTVHHLLHECLCGWEMETDLSGFPPDLAAEVDPMLVGLVLENGTHAFFY